MRSHTKEQFLLTMTTLLVFIAIIVFILPHQVAKEYLGTYKLVPTSNYYVTDTSKGLLKHTYTIRIQQNNNNVSKPINLNESDVSIVNGYSDQDKLIIGNSANKLIPSTVLASYKTLLGDTNTVTLFKITTKHLDGKKTISTKYEICTTHDYIKSVSQKITRTANASTDSKTKQSNTSTSNNKK